MKRITALVTMLSLAALAAAGGSMAAPTAPAAAPAQAAAPAVAPAPAPLEVSQSDLSSNIDKYMGKTVQLQGPFLFTGSDFCYQIRKTKINTRDYLCFALGPVSLVRFYLKKDHPQMEELMKVKKGALLKAVGAFDALGNDYKYIIVDRFEVVEPGK